MSDGAVPSGRHLSAAGLVKYLALQAPTVLALRGTPPVTMFIDPPRQRLGLRTPFEGAAPASPLENLELTIVSFDGGRQLEIAATDRELFADVYAMLCAVADRMQLDGVPPLEAYQTTVQTWARVLSRRRRLSDEQEIGLVGELLLVEALMSSVGQASAVASWRGPASEEHDFGFEALDCEVKSTIGERRRHWIASGTQLMPTRGRPLWFVSIQITRAGDGHGATLPTQIARIESRQDDSIREQFRNTLKHLHWDDRQRDLYTQAWELRSRPLALAVDDCFPRITPNELARATSEHASIVDMRYQVDITGRESDHIIPPPLSTALEKLNGA